MNPVLDRLMSLWREPVDARPDTEAAFPDLRMEVVHDYELPGRIVVAFFMHGRHTGPLATPLGTVPATGRAVTNRVTDILTLTDGRISDIWVISDDLGLLHQLDAVRLA